MAVLYGKHGGVSHKNKDWRSYYGAESYDSYVKNAKEKRKKREEEIARKKKEEANFNREVLNMHLYDRDDEGKIIPNSFRTGLINRMNEDNYNKFFNSLNQQERNLLKSQRDEEYAEIYAEYEEAYEEEYGYDDYDGGDW